MINLVFLLLCVLLSVVGIEGAPSKPHIVFIMVDDYGWANVGYHRYFILLFSISQFLFFLFLNSFFLIRNPPTNEVQTPNIDQLVAEGVEIDRHYAYQYLYFTSPKVS